MKVTRRTIDTTMTAAAVLILLAALPAAVYDTIETGRVYLFSRQFIDELPQRFTASLPACQGKKRQFLDSWQ
ncbi:MAG: hypothetical protein V5B38_13365 [Candidatus Accumulibacter propinquus]|jgi:hypothetical protein